MKRPITSHIAGRLWRRTKPAEAGLARLNIMVQDNADGIAIINEDGLIRFVNPAAEVMFGKSSEDMVGQVFGYPLEVGTSKRLNIVRTGEERSVYDLRVVETEIDGEHGYLASLRNVTAQVKAEDGERLRARELDALARIAGILVQPRELKIKCTEVLEVLTDTVQADCATVRIWDENNQCLRLVAQGGTSSVRRQSVLSIQRSVSAEAMRLEQRVVSNDYASHPLADPHEIEMGIKSIVVLPIKAQGKVMGVVGVISQRDNHFNLERVDLLTVIVDGLGALLENANLYQQVNVELEQRKRAEEALMETETRFRDLVEGSSDILWEADQTCTYTYCSSNAETILGYSPSEMIGQTAYDFMPADEAVRMKEYIEAKAAAGEPFALVEHLVVYQDGGIGYMECSGKPMFDQDGKVVGYRGVDRDITIRKTEEAERRSLEIKALAHSKLATLGEVATGVAHEINQPLTYISTMIQSLQEDLQLNDFDAQSALVRLGESIRQVDRITEIVSHLRTFGRNYDTTFNSVDLRQVLDNTLLLIGDRMRNMKINVQTDFEVGLPKIKGNSSQLEQVLTNMFQNSIYALDHRTQLGGAEIKIKAVLEVGGDAVRIEFSDNGTGIAPAHLEKIFEPFFSTKEVGHGTGLGLPIVYGIVQDHGGSINCQSEWNEGTTMTIVLPVGKET